MPVINLPVAPQDRVNADDIHRPVVTVAMLMANGNTLTIEAHRHKKGQFLFVKRGALSCAVDRGLWIVPPCSALWVPGGVMHAFTVTGPVEGYTAFIGPDVDCPLPTTCCAVAVTPLLRELLVRSATLPTLYPQDGVEARVVSLLLDEIASARIEDLHLPMPSDPRLRRIADLIVDDPSDRATMVVWARRAAMSERTLGRLIVRETGMTFHRWRQQLGVVFAVKWLAEGASIQQVADDLGYESVPAFVTMFRKAVGTSPGRYIAERRASA